MDLREHELLQSIKSTLDRIEINLQKKDDPAMVANSVAESLKQAMREIL